MMTGVFWITGLMAFMGSVIHGFFNHYTRSFIVHTTVFHVRSCI